LKAVLGFEAGGIDRRVNLIGTIAHLSDYRRRNHAIEIEIKVIIASLRGAS
jgi:hypothetical protein